MITIIAIGAQMSTSLPHRTGRLEIGIAILGGRGLVKERQ